MKIMELELLSDAIPQTEVFYTEVLGLEKLFADDTSLVVRAGGTKLVFHASQNKKPIYHFAFDIPKNKFPEAFDWIERKTELLYVKPPDKVANFYNWNAKSFYFYDNNKNIVEFIARFDLDNAVESPFDGSSLVSVSEIGLVSKNVDLLCEELTVKYGLSPYSKQPKLPKFIVLGSVTGLFILVEEKRNWFPTDIQAKSFWTKIVFSVEGVSRQLEIF